MTGPRPDQQNGADPQGVPTIPRILSPDEFDQARMLSPNQLSQAKFPTLPPTFAPRDATKSLDPTTPKQTGTPWTGLAGILTRQVAQPIADSPFVSTLTAAIAPVPGVSHLLLGAMGKDIVDYSAQKAAELTLPADHKAQAEADPNRISGEQAGVEAAMVGGLPLAKGALGAAGEAIT